MKIWMILFFAVLPALFNPQKAFCVPSEKTLITDARCQACHGVKGFAIPRGEHGETRKKHLYVDEAQLRTGVHGKRTCLDCHQDIRKLPHEKNGLKQVDCVSCHEGLKKESEALMIQINASRSMSGLIPAVTPTPATVSEATAFYKDSIHAKTTKENKTVNAECKSCHGTHAVFKSEDSRAQSHRLSSPETCGACHKKALAIYQKSIHGAALKTPWKGKSAVCSDCHSPHRIASSKNVSARRVITENCGDCHASALEGYMASYHGQLAWLGGKKVARCYDCHQAHDTRRANDPASKIHTDNLLKTCRACHKGATENFTAFHPHGNTHDFDKYPQMWVVGKLMVGIVVLVLIFFYTHSALWFYRSWKERRNMGYAHATHFDTHSLNKNHVRRFSWQWRVNHWVLVVSVMTLVTTGMTAMYSGSVWAIRAADLFGGPENAALVHRVAAVGFVMAVLGHFLALGYKLFYRPRKKFIWFGPDSLLPRKQDWSDMVGMFRWFFGKGPQPTFDQWTYWEKFDYWAVGWGLVVIGISGVILWFPTFFARFLPGWIFNVATIAHGIEAFLAVATLFTVHFFNNHFRPGKFPLDIVMFVGGMPMEAFKEERAEAYRRLLKEGTLETYRVPPPSRRAVILSHIAGFTLLSIGLTLLIFVVIGFARQGLF